MESSRYVRAFAAAAERAGATVKEGTQVRSFQHDAGRVSGVVTDDGEIPPGTVVVAAGAWTPLLLEGWASICRSSRCASRSCRPSDGTPARTCSVRAGAVKQYLIFRELPSFKPDAWANDAEARHGKLLEAVCQRNDGSYLLGCAMDYPGFVVEP